MEKINDLSQKLGERSLLEENLNKIVESLNNDNQVDLNNLQQGNGFWLNFSNENYLSVNIMLSQFLPYSKQKQNSSVEHVSS